MKRASFSGVVGLIGAEFEPSTGARIRRMLKAGKSETQPNCLDQAYESTRHHGALYEHGQKDGLKNTCIDLSDVLYSLNRQGLGFASVIQESNSHLVVRIQHCRECERQSPGCGCSYIAGFLAGALRAMGKPATVSVHEVSCGEGNSPSCVFMASW
jgi:predicted hydrocarbon binding protein